MKKTLDLTVVFMLALTMKGLAAFQSPPDPGVVRAEFFTMLIISLVLAAASELLRPKQKIEGERPKGLGEFDFPTALEGRPIPIVFGTVKLSGPNIVWYGDFSQFAKKKKQKTGMFSSQRVVVAWLYSFGIQYALCGGPIDNLKRIWIDEKEVFNGTLSDAATVISDFNFFGGDELGGNGGINGTMRLHNGASNQAVNGYLTTFQTPQSAYRDTCYMVWEGGYFGNSTRIPKIAFEVERFPNSLGLTSSGHIIGVDANIAEVAYELFTDVDWGFGFPASDVDLTSFTAAGNTLASEGNGFSMVIDQTMEASALLEELQRQMDGTIFFDRATGKFKIRLARQDYDPNTVPEITIDNTIEVREFERGAWEGTSNQVRVKFSDRQRDYFETFAQAQDLANQRIQGGELVTSSLSYPGVKDADVANQIASREMKFLGRPLARATLTVTREFWDSNIGDPITWTDADLGFTKLPMRITKMDFGTLASGAIEMTIVEDVYAFEAHPFFAAPTATLWVPPSTDVAGIPAAEQTVFEAPRALIVRDPDLPDTPHRIWCGARSQVGEALFTIHWRSAAGAPTGAYFEDNDIPGMYFIGETNAVIDESGIHGTGDIDIIGLPDTLAALLSEFETKTPGDIGNLAQLVYIDGEFIGVTRATDETTFVRLHDVYRGMLDSVPESHASGSKVHLLFISGGLTETIFVQGNQVDIKLRAQSRTDETTEVEATTINLTMNDRYQRPYPPTELELNTTRYDAAPAFDTLKQGGTSGDFDHQGVDVEWLRRDYRVLDEVENLLTDAVTRDGAFLTTTSTEYRTRVIDDPDGSPTTIITTAWNSGAALEFVSRTDILNANSDVIPTTMRIEVDTRHTFEEVVYTSLSALGWTFTLAASTLDDDFNWGSVAQNVATSNWTAPATGTYNINIGTAFGDSGVVQANVNGAGFVTPGDWSGTNGTFTANSGQTIAIRHGSADSPSLKFCEVAAPSGTVDAWAIFV